MSVRVEMEGEKEASSPFFLVSFPSYETDTANQGIGKEEEEEECDNLTPRSFRSRDLMIMGVRACVGWDRIGWERRSRSLACLFPVPHPCLGRDPPCMLGRERPMPLPH